MRARALYSLSGSDGVGSENAVDFRIPRGFGHAPRGRGWNSLRGSTQFRVQTSTPEPPMFPLHNRSGILPQRGFAAKPKVGVRHARLPWVNRSDRTNLEAGCVLEHSPVGWRYPTRSATHRGVGPITTHYPGLGVAWKPMRRELSVRSSVALRRFPVSSGEASRFPSLWFSPIRPRTNHLFLTSQSARFVSSPSRSATPSPWPKSVCGATRAMISAKHAELVQSTIE